MRLNRRKFIAGLLVSTAICSMPSARAWLHPGKVLINSGWNTLPGGAGGLLWGMHIANDGSMVCRGDVLGAYVWSGTSAMASLTDPAQKWSQVCNFTALGTNFTGVMTAPAQPWEYVQAPGNSQYHYLMTGDVAGASNTYFLYYSVNKGVNFTKSTLSMSETLHNTTQSKSGACYKIAADPNNEKVVYVGMCQYNNNATSIYTTFDRTLGHTWPNFTTAFTDLAGTTVFPQVSAGLVDGTGGFAFDTSLGTTTINGQILTNRIIVGVGGQGIFESTNAGQSWTNITPPAFVAGSSYPYQGFFDGDTTNPNGHNYYLSIAGIKKIYRYVGGGVSGWADITPSAYVTPTPLLASITVDPRPNAVGAGGGVGYLTAWGPNGVTNGFTTTTATAATPTWNGSTAPRNVTLKGSPTDIGYMDYIFGQGAAAGFTNGICALIDSNGTNFWCGNQSIWYFTAIPNWGVSTTSTSISFGRGQEGVVACDIICPPGAPYPIVACQDVGAPLLGGTYTTYPTDMLTRFGENTCQNLEYSPDDPSFIVARATGQPSQNDPHGDYSSYSTNYGAIGSWTKINYGTGAVWQTLVNGSITGNVLTVNSLVSGSASCTAGSISGVKFTPGGTITGTFLPGMFLDWGNVAPGTVITVDNGDGTFNVSNSLTVAATAITGSVPSTQVFPGAWVNNSVGAQIYPYGTAGTTGTGGVGTYALNGSPGNVTNVNIPLNMYVTAGQLMPVDKDHWIAIPDYPNMQYIPAVTSNARAATLGGTTSWSLCNGLPVRNWMTRGGWSFGATTKPIATGYGTDLGTAWAVDYYNDIASASSCTIDDGAGGAGNILTASGTFTAPLRVGQLVTATGVAANTTILSFGTGTGGAGTYNVSGSAQLVTARAMTMQTNPTVITLYRSTDSGANFSAVQTTTGQVNSGGMYLLAVPGFPDELWLGSNITTGASCFWHITGARTAVNPTITPIATPPIIGSNPARSILHTLTLGAPATPGGYPLLYATFQQNGVGQVPSWLYQGSWNSGTSTMTWNLYGPAGSTQGRQDQLPQSMQINGIGFIRGHWDVPGRIFVGNNGLGSGYYNP